MSVAFIWLFSCIIHPAYLILACLVILSYISRQPYKSYYNMAAGLLLHYKIPKAVVM